MRCGCFVVGVGAAGVRVVDFMRQKSSLDRIPVLYALMGPSVPALDYYSDVKEVLKGRACLGFGTAVQGESAVVEAVEAAVKHFARQIGLAAPNRFLACLSYPDQKNLPLRDFMAALDTILPGREYNFCVHPANGQMERAEVFVMAAPDARGLAD